MKEMLIVFSVWGSSWSVCPQAPSRPRLPAQDAHTSSIDADKSPRCPFIVDGERAYKYMRVGAVGVPMALVDPQAARVIFGAPFPSPCPLPPRVAGSRDPVCGGFAGGLVKELFFDHVVDCNVGKNNHLVAPNVCSSRHVAHPFVDAIADGILPPVYGA